MLQAVLFDMGGTLDADGVHWLDRFAALYAACRLPLDRERLRGAFDEAERRAARDDGMATASLSAMVQQHVTWQLEHLGIDRRDLCDDIVAGFVAGVREVAAVNGAILGELSRRGLRLGVVSNGCGNVDMLCRELGYAPHLSTIVDSRRVGLYKPDPAIFIFAAASLGVPPSATMMVGDSFDRDIAPAHGLGMTTAWLEGPVERACADPSLVDVRLPRLSALPAALEAMTMTSGAGVPRA